MAHDDHRYVGHGKLPSGFLRLHVLETLLIALFEHAESSLLNRLKLLTTNLITKQKLGEQMAAKPLGVLATDAI